jgi:hypothetical protein
MTKWIALACAMAFVFLPTNSQNERFSKYKRIEAYQIRPGIMIIPKYSTGGEVCLVAIQRNHFDDQEQVASLDSTVPREVLTQIFDELVPPDERGTLTLPDEFARLSVYGGGSATSLLDYKNVSFQISRLASTPGDVVAVIQWKGRLCK